VSDASGELLLVRAVPVVGPLFAPFIVACSRGPPRLGLKNLIEHLLHEQVIALIVVQDLFKFLVAWIDGKVTALVWVWFYFDEQVSLLTQRGPFLILSCARAFRQEYGHNQEK